MILLHFTPQELHIAAPPALVWEILAAVGRGRLPGSPNRARIVEQQGPQRAIIEFISATGANKPPLTTLEEVVFYPPDRMTFRHLSGPLPYVREEYRLTPNGTGTFLHYQGEYRAPYGPLGWLLGPLYIRPLADRLVLEHMQELKQAAEARFARTHVYPRSRNSNPPPSTPNP